MADLSFLPHDLEAAKLFLKKQGLEDNAENTRAKILCCWKSVDIQACPGSGKTTILVTKLAWAIENWKLDNAGICVLSHTNVAKDEIKKRLTGSQASKLFSYPHFVGTIHEFLIKFLAIPWLKANNNVVCFIDNDVAYNRCEKAIWGIKDSGFNQEFKKKFKRINKHNWDNLTKLNWYVDQSSQLQLLNPHNEFGEFQRLIKSAVMKQGYHTHNDMVAFSQKLLFENPNLPKSMQSRFPIVLIDEAQDTNETLSTLLSTIFDPNKIIFQRFGDSDQQIFDFDEEQQTLDSETEENTLTDRFQDSERLRDDLRLSETQRCSMAISTVASKLSLSNKPFQSCNKTVNEHLPVLILFDDKNQDVAQKVVERFVELIPEGIKKNEKSVIKVVGQIGKRKKLQKNATNEEFKNFPYSICDYQTNYLKPKGGRSSRARNLYDAIEISRELFTANGNENCNAINAFFSGIAILLADNFVGNNESPHSYRYVREQLKRNELNANGQSGEGLLSDLRTIYADIVNTQREYSDVDKQLRESLQRNGFTRFDEQFFEAAPKKLLKKACNRIETNNLSIDLNTIAGVKGETHTATLILETFFCGHNIKNAIQIMAGLQVPAKDLEKKRIRNLYVAMTRPTDFLCIALPKSEYEELCEDMFTGLWLNNDALFTVDRKLATCIIE